MYPRNKFFADLNLNEKRVFERLNTPQKIQDYLDTLKMNFADADPCFCPRQVLQFKKAHCMEGALLAAAALAYHGRKPLLLDLTTTKEDEDHVVALFKQDGFWGAISKTNHVVLRYREPIYRTVRELAMSYFHEYFLSKNGEKTLRTFSKPFSLSKYQTWVTSQKDIMEIIQDMSDSKHQEIITTKQIKNLRKADKIEIKAGKIVEWRQV